MTNENKDKKLEALAEQWVNLVMAHIESKKHSVKVLKNKNKQKHE